MRLVLCEGADSDLPVLFASALCLDSPVANGKGRRGKTTDDALKDANIVSLNINDYRNQTEKKRALTSLLCREKVAILALQEIRIPLSGANRIRFEGYRAVTRPSSKDSAKSGLARKEGGTEPGKNGLALLVHKDVEYSVLGKKSDY